MSVTTLSVYLAMLSSDLAYQINREPADSDEISAVISHSLAWSQISLETRRDIEKLCNIKELQNNNKNSLKTSVTSEVGDHVWWSPVAHF